MWIIDVVACIVLMDLLMRRTKNNEGVGKEVTVIVENKKTQKRNIL